MLRSIFSTVCRTRTLIHKSQFVIRQEHSNAIVPREGDIVLLDKAKEISIKEAVVAEPSSELRLVKGWVQSRRKLGQWVFFHLTDRVSSEKLQVVMSRDYSDSNDIQVGDGIECFGIIQESHGKEQRVDLVCNSLKIVGKCNMQTLISPKSTPESLPNARRHLHVRPLMKPMANILKVRSSVLSALHKYFDELGYTYVTTPIITCNDCEGGSEAFQVKSPTCTDKEKFFDRDAFLTVSGQLHLEAMVSSLAKVFTISPAFRAEKSLSQRHLSEFTMLEVEESFLDDIDVLMDRVEHLCRFVANHVIENCADDHQKILECSTIKKYSEFKKLTHPKKYLRLTYDDCLEILSKSPKNVDQLKWGDDICRRHEKILLDYFENYPIFISHYPASLKPFYMKRVGDRALCIDLIANVGGEICGGSLRENDCSILEKNLENLGLSESLSWYLELRKIGCVPHGGYGIGFDRLIQAIVGIENIRDVVPFPRWIHRLSL